MTNTQPGTENHLPVSFHCPNCGAGLELIDHAKTTTCKYCSTKVLVPLAYQTGEFSSLTPSFEEKPIRIEITHSSVPVKENRSPIKTGGWIIIILVAVIVPLTIIAIASFIFVNTAVQISEEFITQIPTVVQEIEIVETRYEPTPTPNLYAQPLLEFGEEGTGPGQFDDARQIAVGLDGSIYVADYNSGRVQKFDPQGKFLYQILVEPGRNGTWIIHDLAVDTAGQLYVVRVGDILVYNGLDGKLMNTIDGKDLKAFFQAAAVDTTNKLYALHATASEDDLVLFDQAGTLLQRNQDIITQVNPKDAAMDLMIAVDGTGNSYILSTFGNQVYIYDRFSNFIDRFGSVGKSPGQFDNPNGIAVDGNKMIYVLNSQEVQQFDENGTYLRSLKIQPGNGAWRDLVLDTQGNLYIVTGLGKVLKFEPIQP